MLELPPGRYAGPAVINRPIIINGKGQVVIDGEGEGTAITIRADKTHSPMQWAARPQPFGKTNGLKIIGINIEVLTKTR